MAARNNHLYKVFRNGTNTNAVGNYSATPTKFSVTPDARTKYFITDVHIHIQDSGVFDATRYGNGVLLSVGVKIELHDALGAVINTYTDGLLIRTNADWYHLCHDVEYIVWGSGEGVLIAKWDINHDDVSNPIVIDGRLGESLVITLNDDFTGLTRHYFIAHGYQLGLT